MTKYISFLRGINVGGKRKILMSDLKKLYEHLGYSNITTYIQSGNVIFDFDKKINTRQLENEIQNSIFENYGFDVPVMIRSISEMKQSIASNPFRKTGNIEQLHLTFLKENPDPDKLENIKKFEYPPDKFIIDNKYVFILFSGKSSDSKLTNSFFEKKLNVRATNRNWKTVNKLFEIATNY